MLAHATHASTCYTCWHYVLTSLPPVRRPPQAAVDWSCFGGGAGLHQVALAGLKERLALDSDRGLTPEVSALARGGSGGSAACAVPVPVPVPVLVLALVPAACRRLPRRCDSSTSAAVLLRPPTDHPWPATCRRPSSSTTPASPRCPPAAAPLQPLLRNKHRCYVPSSRHRRLSIFSPSRPAPLPL